MEISYNSTSLYKLIKEINNEEQINNVIKLLTLDQIYCHFGHIISATAFKLFYNGIVISLELEFNDNADYFSKSCIFSKST